VTDTAVVVSPALRNALGLLMQYRRLNKGLKASELHALRISINETIACGGTVSLVFTDTGPRFEITTKPTRAVKAKKE
jgi:hypothetical protein